MLYLIFITIAILIFTYYIFSDKSAPIKVIKAVKSVKAGGGNTANKIVEELFDEIDLDSIKNIIPKTKFSEIIITPTDI